MKIRPIHIIIYVIAITILSFIMINIFKEEEVQYGSSEVKIIDVNTKEEIDNAIIIVTELHEQFTITKDNNKIYLPKKPYECYGTKNCDDKGKFPYGYTTITTVEGYLPRIDYNLILGYEGTKIVIEMTKEADVNNRNHYYEEHFHNYSPNIIYQVFEYYDLNSNK